MPAALRKERVEKQEEFGVRTANERVQTCVLNELLSPILSLSVANVEISGGGPTLSQIQAISGFAEKREIDTNIKICAELLYKKQMPSGLGGHSPLLHTKHPLKFNGARYIPSPPGEKVRMRGHKGTVESRQHRYAFLSRGEGGHSPLLHTGHPRKRNGTHYTILSKGEERNLLPNAVRLEISGGGWTSPLLHSWGALKKYGARLMCGSNEPTPTRISKFAGSLRNSALPLGEGGHSPLLHSGCPLQPNMLRSVIPQQFRCIPEGVGALRVDTVHSYTLGTRENATGTVTFLLPLGRRWPEAG